jgi:hypothetical protein
MMREMFVQADLRVIRMALSTDRPVSPTPSSPGGAVLVLTMAVGQGAACACGARATAAAHRQLQKPEAEQRGQFEINGSVGELVVLAHGFGGIAMDRLLEEFLLPSCTAAFITGVVIAAASLVG